MTPRRAPAAVVLLAWGSLMVGGGRALPHADGPPPGHTGGFGEPTCQACHADAPLNDPSGTLTVTGLPAHYAPDRTYVVLVELERTGLRRAGFQLSLRLADGTQAGAVAPFDASRTAVTLGGTDVAYAHQTDGGTEVRGGRAVWRVSWRAPADAAGPVRVHVAANASNDDDSELGDYVYTFAGTVALGDSR